jgi:uncharacterized cupin superfamily protein
MPTKPEPLVGGEPARLILDTIRSFPLSIRFDGRVEVENTATGEAAEAFARAYEVMELDVMTRQFQCTIHEAHRTVDEHEFRMMVLGAMVIRARVQLDDWRVDGMWS